MTELRDLQRVEELSGAVLRAWTGRRDLAFRGHRVCRDGRPVGNLAAHLGPIAGAPTSLLRGAGDGAGLALAVTDAALHAARAPADPAARVMFDLLEQYRVESNVPDTLAGVRHNLEQRHEAWSEAFMTDSLTESEAGLLVFAVVHVCRSRLTSRPMPDRVQDLIESTRMALAPAIGGTLAALRRHRHDQAAFAESAAEIARFLAARLREIDLADDRGGADARRGGRSESRSLWPSTADVLDESMGPATEAPGQSRRTGGDALAYRPYTTRYDEVVHAAELVRPAQLDEFRRQMDHRSAAAGINVARLARDLRTALGQPVVDGDDGERESGRIDGRALSRLIASPANHRIFRDDRRQIRSDAIVTFLLDCSGSMKRHVDRVSLLVDVTVRALEQAGVAVEVLGFTTSGWNGGRARRDWVREGSPRMPGRLNDIRHIVFKPADRTWRQSRRALAALHKPELYREGVDGEAVAWACARLRASPQVRRHLLVLSDGSPMDTATAQANGPQYLDDHLREVVGDEARAGGVAIAALGVGLDLTPYYPTSRVFDLDIPPGRGMFADLIDLVRMSARRRRGA